MIPAASKILAKRWVVRVSFSLQHGRPVSSLLGGGDKVRSSATSATANLAPTSDYARGAPFESFMRPGGHLTQVRGKKNKAARMGQHLKRLDEMAHEKAHDEAVERRKNKKEKKAARKGKKGNSSLEEEEEDTDESPIAAAMESSMGDSLDDYEEEEMEDDDEEEEGLLPDTDKVKQQMDTIVESFAAILKKIRGAEPTPEMFDEVQVEAYGAKTNLQSVAQVVIVTPTRAEATCFDLAVSKSVCKAIQVSMGLNPSVEEGGTIRIPLPRVSMETREKTAKALGKRTESYRQRIRKVRRKNMDVLKQGVAGKLEHVSKDDAFRVQKEVEAATDGALAKLNEMAQKKHDSIMQVQ